MKIGYLGRRSIDRELAGSERQLGAGPATRGRRQGAALLAAFSMCAPYALGTIATGCSTHEHGLDRCRERILASTGRGGVEECEGYLLSQGVRSLPEAFRIYRNNHDGLWLAAYLRALIELEDRKFSKLARWVRHADAGLVEKGFVLVSMDGFEAAYVLNPVLAYEAEFGPGTWPPDVPIDDLAARDAGYIYAAPR